MILRNYIYGNIYLNLEKNIKIQDANISEYDGYFQDHPIGTIYFKFAPNPYLQIGNKKYDLSKINK